jgi:radical SAM superfamily enzyme YgiQ (UPF0313 family)
MTTPSTSLAPARRTTLPATPEEPVRCLLIQAEFSAFSFWNYVEACKPIDAKTPMPPLGLMTVAALLPQHWEFRLVDLNCQPLTEADWAWTNLVLCGGMLPQQSGILAIIERARASGRFVGVGGPDPTMQPAVYGDADVLVLNEGEITIPMWLDAWRRGAPAGRFTSDEKPDVTGTPIPRFDLLRFNDYEHVGIQYSRGCPFNCEFCDIIELYGRKPRTKSPDQVLRELDRLLELGYSGAIDLVDDNFIGNLRAVKRDLLPALTAWGDRNRHPFYFFTEASLNVGDDMKLLAAMREAGFRGLFLGIETPNPELLLRTQKTQNTVHPMRDRIHAIYAHGMVVAGGFILGFDGEKAGADKAIEKTIDECHVVMAMVGLLVALPGTQLTRRLLRENRLIGFDGTRVTTEAELEMSALAKGSNFEVIDQTIAGLNFITTRNRLHIIDELSALVTHIYSPRAYFDRVLAVGKLLQMKSKYRPRRFARKRMGKGFLRVSRILLRDPRTRWLYVRNFLRILPRGIHVVEQTMRLMGVYTHFDKQAQYLVQALAKTRFQHERLPLEMPKERESA